MKLINFQPPKGMAPKAVRTNTKTAKIIQLCGRKNGCTLTELAKEMSKVGGQENTPQSARGWVQPSYLKDKGYGIRSELTANGKDIRLFLVHNDLPLDTSRSDVGTKTTKVTSKKKASKRSTKKVAAAAESKPAEQPAAETPAKEEGEAA